MQFNVPDMSCGHCTAAIEKSVKAADPGADVACDLDTHRVSINSVLAPEQVSAAIKDAGYDAQQVSA
ncbi:MULTISPECIES: heavy-metal-associated domain-containing protein [Rhodobacterales]|jgi:copper chaperone|uniref:Copper chaperone n=3 Tax=Rhodobacterales TaxID=204455 RepID=A0A1P8UNZ4_9RHOB|nr:MULTISPECIES: heavy-metal-associated domain-containing protein [Rhodobacterales]APZ51110.1 copper chaperone [Salipiger abyssi]MWB78449.1 copper chaperone [Pseudooceanicola pacificus]PTX41342.1 copper chaperone [Allosediminivita pacifica]GGB23793.1 hypothetical protein GCM10011324_37240 [Allosediminivita pacifica]